jgi:hypothetical protein
MFLLRVTLTLTMTHMTLLTQTSHSRPIMTVDLPYRSPQAYRASQWASTNVGSPHQYDPSPLSVCDRKAKRPSTSQEDGLDTVINNHWLMKCRGVRCRVCALNDNDTRVKFKRRECNIRLCATPYFEVYHTKLNF